MTSSPFLSQIQIPTGDLLASIGDADIELIRAGIVNGGKVVIDPNTVTVEGLRLLCDAFNGQELRVTEDKVSSACVALCLPRNPNSCEIHRNLFDCDGLSACCN